VGGLQCCESFWGTGQHPVVGPSYSVGGSAHFPTARVPEVINSQRRNRGGTPQQKWDPSILSGSSSIPSKDTGLTRKRADLKKPAKGLPNVKMF